MSDKSKNTPNLDTSARHVEVVDAHDEAAKAQGVMPTIKGLIRLWEQAESGKAFAHEMMFLLNKVADKAAADEREACCEFIKTELDPWGYANSIIKRIRARGKEGGA